MKIEIISSRKIHCPACVDVKHYLKENKYKFIDLYVEDMPKYINTWEFRNFTGWPHVWIDGKFRFHGKPAYNVMKGIFNPKFHKVLNRKFKRG